MNTRLGATGRAMSIGAIALITSMFLAGCGDDDGNDFGAPDGSGGSSASAPQPGGQSGKQSGSGLSVQLSGVAPALALLTRLQAQSSAQVLYAQVRNADADTRIGKVTWQATGSTGAPRRVIGDVSVRLAGHATTVVSMDALGGGLTRATAQVAPRDEDEITPVSLTVGPAKYTAQGPIETGGGPAIIVSVHNGGSDEADVIDAPTVTVACRDTAGRIVDALAGKSGTVAAGASERVVIKLNQAVANAEHLADARCTGYAATTDQ